MLFAHLAAQHVGVNGYDNARGVVMNCLLARGCSNKVGTDVLMWSSVLTNIALPPSKAVNTSFCLPFREKNWLELCEILVSHATNILHAHVGCRDFRLEVSGQLMVLLSLMVGGGKRGA